MSNIQPWPEEIRKHLIGECRECLAIIADSPAYGRAPGENDPTLCEVCDVRHPKETS